MTAPANIHLKEHLVLTAIWQCFHSNETILSLHQLMLRRLTPTEAMSRHYIGVLLRLGLIKPSDVLDEPGIFLSIKGGKSYFTAVGALTEPAPTLSRSALTTNYRASHASLLEIIFELLAANVVEYVKYFAEREQLNVKGLDYKSPSLRIFFENTSLSQTFMLFWRAIKSSAETQRSVNFEHIVVLAYQFFEDYCSSGKEIKPYPRPRGMAQSRLEKIIFHDVLNIRNDPDLLPNIHEYLTGTINLSFRRERHREQSYFVSPFVHR